MKLKVVDYHIEHDTIEIVYATSEKDKPCSKIAKRTVWDELLDEVKTGKRGLTLKSEDIQMLNAILSKGGTEWLTDEVNELIEL